MVTALPKSMYRKKPAEPMNTSSLRFAKVHPLRDEEYRSWLTDKNTGRCWLKDIGFPCRTIGERKPAEFAHLTALDGNHRGMATKGSDAHGACLCPAHHDAYDAMTLPYEVMLFLWVRSARAREVWWQMRKTA